APADPHPAPRPTRAARAEPPRTTPPCTAERYHDGRSRDNATRRLTRRLAAHYRRDIHTFRPGGPHMKIVAAAVVLVTGLAAAAVAASGTEVDTFEKQVGKYAAPGGIKDKSLCVCLDPGAFFYGAAGFVRQTRDLDSGVNLVRLRCVIQGYDPTTGALYYQ